MLIMLELLRFARIAAWIPLSALIQAFPSHPTSCNPCTNTGFDATGRTTT